MRCVLAKGQSLAPLAFVVFLRFSMCSICSFKQCFITHPHALGCADIWILVCYRIKSATRDETKRLGLNALLSRRTSPYAAVLFRPHVRNSSGRLRVDRVTVCSGMHCAEMALLISTAVCVSLLCALSCLSCLTLCVTCICCSLRVFALRVFLHL
jgi:hypothetical protein